MRHHIRLRLVIVTMSLGLLFPLRQSTASPVTPTLTQTPVAGRLAAGGTFAGQLTIHAVALDAQGQLIATGTLSGTAVLAAGDAITLPRSPFTSLVALLDPPGDCLTIAV